jgi:hypothetical protein
VFERPLDLARLLLLIKPCASETRAQGGQSMRLHLVTAVVAGSITLSAFLLGCDATVTTTTTISPPAGCSTDSSLICRRGSTGFTCSTGVNPEELDSSLSCSIPVRDSAGDHFCCFVWRGGSTCTPDDNVTSFCSDPSSFGYSCAPNDNPETTDPTLVCSTPSVDPVTGGDDFCCR